MPFNNKEITVRTTIEISFYIYFVLSYYLNTSTLFDNIHIYFSPGYYPILHRMCCCLLLRFQ